MKMKIRSTVKKWIAMLCVFALVFSFVPSAFAGVTPPHLHRRKETPQALPSIAKLSVSFSCCILL